MAIPRILTKMRVRNPWVYPPLPWAHQHVTLLPAPQLKRFLRAATTAMAADESKVMKYVCGEGDDCPCHSTERKLPARPTLSPRPHEVKADATLWLCQCGLSKTYPLCDGSHKAYNAEHGTSFAPKPLVVKEDKTAYLCQCGHSGSFPFCDGTHKKVHPVEKKD